MKYVCCAYANRSGSCILTFRIFVGPTTFSTLARGPVFSLDELFGITHRARLKARRPKRFCSNRSSGSMVRHAHHERFRFPLVLSSSKDASANVDRTGTAPANIN